MPHTAVFISVKAMDGANAREFSFGSSLQIVGRRKSLHVCNAPKADAKLGPGSLSRRLMAIIAMSPQFGHYGLRRKTNWWDNFKKSLNNSMGYLLSHCRSRYLISLMFPTPVGSASDTNHR
jgi:hypothetical protein